MRSEKRNVERKGRRLGIGGAALALILALVLVFSSVSQVAAATTADANTADSYTGSLGDASSTQYDGRVWTDKTVYTGDAEFSGEQLENQTIEKGDNDFLISYSALATSTQITGEASVPVDVVFVIDDSSSMTNDHNTALQQTVAAVNQSIHTLMTQNENNRVAVVLYGNKSETLLPLGHYTSKAGNSNNYIAYDDEGRYFKNTVNEDVNYNNPSSGWWGHNGWLDMGSNDNGRGTNIQMGIYTGMNILATNKDTTVTVDGTTVNRVPAVVLLSDGSPTYSSSSRSW